MTNAISVVQTIATAAKPWAKIYSDSTAVSSAVTFLHVAGLLFAGGLAVATDRATFRALRGTEDDRSRLLTELSNSHGFVIGGLVVIFASGLLLALSDVKTFATSGIYWTKMGLVALLLLNGLVLQRAERGLRTASLLDQPVAPKKKLWSRLKFSAAASLTLWTAITLAGVILVEAS